MEVKEVEVTKTEKMVTMTESEYEKLLIKERKYGAIKTKQYIAFCYLNFRLRMNFRGNIEFVDDLSKFLSGQSDCIGNTYNWDFWTWLEHNRD